MPKTKKNKFGKILKNHFLLTAAIIAFYVSLGFVFGWDLLAGDLKNKKQVAGSTVSALMRIIGPPVTPVLNGNSLCSVENEPYIRLNWNADPDADEYDLYRDDEILMPNITTNSWNDFNVLKDRNYSYHLVARGSEGIAVSEKISIQAVKCPLVDEPRIWVEKINNQEIGAGLLSISEGRPVFVGQTNIPNALIDLQFSGIGDQIYATVQANNNGFWQWISPVYFSFGEYYLNIEAVHPDDFELTAQTSLTFLVVKGESSKKEKSKEDKSKADSESQIIIEELREIIFKGSSGLGEQPFDFSLDFSQDVFIKGVTIGEEVFRGEDLEIGILFSEETGDELSAQINYRVISTDGKIFLEQKDFMKVGPNSRIEKIINLPYSWPVGEYRLQINVSIGGISVSHEDYFILKNRPLAQIGAGYLTFEDLVGKLSWVIIACLNFLFVFILLAIWEHHLTRRAIIQVTEKILRRRGFVG